MSKTFALVHERSGRVAATVARAESLWSRGWGVIPWDALPPGRGLWLPGVGAVHTCFVRFSLDLLFLDGEMRTLRSESGVPPWRLLARARGARHTVELGAGTLSQYDIRIGDCWRLNGLTPSERK